MGPHLRAILALALVPAVAAWYADCQDTKDWYHTTNSNGQTKRCHWVGKKDDYGRCEKTGAIVSGAACSLACLREGTDSPGFETDNGKDCDWVSKKPESRCNVTGTDSAENACPDTCGVCPHRAQDICEEQDKKSKCKSQDCCKWNKNKETCSANEDHCEPPVCEESTRKKQCKKSDCCQWTNGQCEDSGACAPAPTPSPTVPNTETMTVYFRPVNDYESVQDWKPYGGPFTFDKKLVSARYTVDWKDQGWGNRKGSLGIIQNDTVSYFCCAQHYQEVIEIDLNLDALANDKSDIQPVYAVGGGGGHALHIYEASLSLVFEVGDSG
jgi:hypothetical protein